MTTDIAHRSPGTILVDSHVHLHAEHPLGRVLGSAVKNFARDKSESTSACVLMLTQTPRARWGLEALSVHANGWTVEPIERGLSAEVSNEHGQRLLLIIGHQVITQERLEVLALCAQSAPPDGKPIDDTIRTVQESGGFPVLPWGFGKWWGDRGRVIEKILRATELGGVALGDNAGRPVGMPAPRAFGLAAQRGIPILPGTDPLAIPGHAIRPGSFGFVLDGGLDIQAPAESLVRILRELRESPEVFGARTNPVSFALDQVSIRVRKALGKGGVA